MEICEEDLPTMFIKKEEKEDYFAKQKRLA